MNLSEIPYKEGDIVVIRSVSGHNDIKHAVGRRGVIKNIRDVPPFKEDKVWYKYHVKYTHPIKCACSKKCNDWHGDWFATHEIEYVE